MVGTVTPPPSRGPSGLPPPAREPHPKGLWTHQPAWVPKCLLTLGETWVGARRVQSYLWRRYDWSPFRGPVWYPPSKHGEPWTVEHGFFGTVFLYKPGGAIDKIATFRGTNLGGRREHLVCCLLGMFGRRVWGGLQHPQNDITMKQDSNLNFFGSPNGLPVLHSKLYQRLVSRTERCCRFHPIYLHCFLSTIRDTLALQPETFIAGCGQSSPPERSKPVSIVDLALATI